jgi:hypothetical protein
MVRESLIASPEISKSVNSHETTRDPFFCLDHCFSLSTPRQIHFNLHFVKDKRGDRSRSLDGKGELP